MFGFSYENNIFNLFFDNYNTLIVKEKCFTGKSYTFNIAIKQKHCNKYHTNIIRFIQLTQLVIILSI